MDSLKNDIKVANHKRRNVYFNKSGGCIKENNVYCKKDISTTTKQQNIIYNNIYSLQNVAGLEKKKGYFHNRVVINSKHILNLNKNINLLNKTGVKDQKIKNENNYSYYEPLRYPAFKMSDILKSQKIKNEETKNNMENNNDIRKNEKEINNDSMNKEHAEVDKKKVDTGNNKISMKEIMNEKKSIENNFNITNTLSYITEEENNITSFNEIFFMQNNKEKLKNKNKINNKNADYTPIPKENVVNHKMEIYYEKNKEVKEEEEKKKVQNERKIIDNMKEFKYVEKKYKKSYNDKYDIYLEKYITDEVNAVCKEELTDNMDITQRSIIYSSDEDNYYCDKENQEIKKFLSFNQNKNFINPKEITNEVKFILHMTLLTLYKDQIKPTYRKIKQRLKYFNENFEIKYNFLNIYASLKNQYIVVRSKENNIFVLLRETPKWFSGWVKTRSFKNSYPKKMWKKFITYFLDICKSKKRDSHISFLIDFVKYLNKKKYIFSLNEKSEDLWNLYDCSINGDVGNDIPNKYFLFNLENNDFSYFSHCNNSYREYLENKFLYYYNIFLEEIESDIRLNKTDISENGQINNEDVSNKEKLTHVEKYNSNNDNKEKKIVKDKNSFNLRNKVPDDEKKVDTEIPWELDNDIYEVANFLKKKNFNFFKDYSLGKIAHIIQLSLYSGLMHEEDQLIKPSCAAKNIVSSIFCIKNNEDNMNSSNVSNLNYGNALNSFSKEAPSENTKNGNYKNFENFEEFENFNISLDELIFDESNFEVANSFKKQNYHSCEIEKNYQKNDDFLKTYESYTKNDEYFFKSDEYFFKNEEDLCKNNEAKYYVPIKNIEDAKFKIENLLKNSYKKRIFLCLFREKFFRKYKETINPLYFGYNSLIEFLFFSCKDVCKIYILNNNLILYHSSCNLEYLQKKNSKENILEEFSYSDYCYNKPEKENSKFKNASLEICSIMKDLAKRRNTFFITFCFWKNIINKNKNILDDITFLNGEECNQRINRNNKEENNFLINNNEPQDDFPHYTYFINNRHIFNTSCLFNSKQHNYDDYFNSSL